MSRPRPRAPGLALALAPLLLSGVALAGVDPTIEPGGTANEETAAVAPLPSAAPISVEATALDRSKSDVLADAEESAPEKLPLRPKIKECCGYPIGKPQGFKMTFYWLAYEVEYANEKYNTDIYSKDGWWIGRYPNTFVWELRMEGTGVLRDGRVINYDGECRYGVGVCFKVLDVREAPLGRGVQQRALEPFRSIAVDPRYIPIGSAVYVPEIVGLQLPDGTLHDGCLRADDQGGGIRLREMDFFVESWFHYKQLASALWGQDRVTPMLEEPRCQYLRLGVPRERENEHTDWAMLHSSKHRQAMAPRAKPKHRNVWSAPARRHEFVGKRSAVAMHSGKGGGGGGGRGGGKLAAHNR